MTSVKVAVRVRPFNQQEKEEKAYNCITMEGPSTTIANKQQLKESNFTFDHSYWSCGKYRANQQGYFQALPGSQYADQIMVFNDMGKYVIDSSFQGFNACLFAYGQTGTGKSYTMFGYGPNAGVVPRSFDYFFQRIQQETIPGVQEFHVEMSMLQIYNEIVLDLLVSHKKKRDKKFGLDIRERPSGEIFVEGLNWTHVRNKEEVETELQFGNCNRTVRATNMNATSGRGHTIVSIKLKRIQIKQEEKEEEDQDKKQEGEKKQQEEKKSKKITQPPGVKRKQQAVQQPKQKITQNTINLVDLAGSENLGGQDKVVNKKRLLQGGNINKSLSVLWKCITILADKSVGKKKNAVVPYRQSKLTRFLQNNLGGNSKTAMIATVSPASTQYDQTLYTLYYAYQVKKIKNKAFSKQISPNKILKQLKRKNDQMRQEIGDAQEVKKILQKPKWASRYHLKNLNQDPLLTGAIRHILDDGDNKVGSGGNNDVEIGGIGVTHDHCIIKIDQNTGNCMINPNDESPMKNQTLVNGKLLQHPEKLKHLDRVRFGLHNYFVFIDPNQVDTHSDENIDWQFANDEAMKNSGDDLNKFGHFETRDYKDTVQQLQNLKMQKQAMRLGHIKKMKQMEQQHQRKKNQMQKDYENQLKTALPQNKANIQAKYQQQLDDLQKQREQAEHIQRLDQKDLLAAIRKREKKDLARQLQELLIKITIANQVFGMIGKYNYLYEPYIDIISDGNEQKSVLCVKAFPDRQDKQQANIWSIDEFDIIYQNVMDHWQAYQYDDDDDQADGNFNKDNKAMKMKIKEQKQKRQAESFGMGRDDENWKLIGTSHLFLNGVYNMIEMPNDTTPIIDKQGKNKGTLKYSIRPIVYNANGKQQNVLQFENMQECEGKRLGIQILVSGAGNLPIPLTYKTKFNYHFPYDIQKTRSKIVENTREPQYDNQTVHQFDLKQDIDEKIGNGIVKVDVYGMNFPDNLVIPEHSAGTMSKSSSNYVSLTNDQIKARYQPPTNKDGSQNDTTMLNEENQRLKQELNKLKMKGFKRKDTCCCVIF